MVASSKSFAAMVAAAAMATQVNGHGYMSNPAATFISSAGDKTQYIATIESSASGFSGTFNSDPATNTASFTTAFASSSYSSLKDFIEAKGQVVSSSATLTCGLTDPDATAQALPDTYVNWAHSDSEGFTASHEGPCEVWCDSTRVFQDDDCAAHYTTAPANLPYESASCSGASRLTIYWLALHSSQWQVYINCAPLSGSTSTSTSTSTTTSSSTGSASSTPSSSTSTSTSTSDTPTVTTASPTTTTSSSSTGTTSTSTTTTTTAPSTSTGSTSTGSTTTTGSTSTGSTTSNGWGSTTTTTAPSTSTGSKSTGSASNTWGNWGASSGNQGTWNNGMSFGFN